MSVPIKLPEPHIKNSDVSRWLRKHHLKRTQANISRATNALRAEKQFDAIPYGRDVSSHRTDAPRQIIYGQARVGGTITFLDIRGNNQYFDAIVTIAGHEVDSVQKVYLDDAEVVFQSGTDGWSSHFILPDGSHVDATNKFFLRVTDGADDQAAIGDLVALNSKWTADHRQRSCAHAYIILVWDGFLYGDGFPEISFLVNGKPVYDPRTTTTYFTNLVALCAADYLMDTRIGVGVPSSRIDMGTDPGGLQYAANICGEDIPRQDGSTEKRYTANGYWDAEEAHGRVLERFAAAMGGNIVFSNGLWKFFPAEYRAPSITLTEDDLRGPIRMQTLASRDDIFNKVRGKFVSAAQGFKETDYPAVGNSTYQTQDGREIVENIDFELVTSSSTCQRLAKIELERIRQGIQIDANFSLKAYQLQVTDTVAITLSRYGWASKVFEVVRADLSLEASNEGPELVVPLSLRETASGVFAWNYWEENIGDIAPNTNLPSPFYVGSPTNVMLASGTSELYLRGDGTVAPRIKVSWDTLSDFFVTSGGRIEIQYKLSVDSIWLDAPSVPGSSTIVYISDVRDGVYYDVRVRGVSAFGNVSAWVTQLNHFVVGKTAKPADVTGFAAAVNEYGIQLQWIGVSDLDLRYYEVREGSTWDAGVVRFQNNATRVALDLRAVGTHTFWIKAVDTSMNYSTNAVSASAVITAPTIPGGGSSFAAGNAILDWDEATGGSWAVDGYNVYYGATFAGATFLAFTKSSLLSVVAQWSGLRRFWVEPRDIFGNVGSAFNIDITINVPGAVTGLAPQVIDNNVLLSWTAPAGSTLPIDMYVVKRGDVYASATTIGTLPGTFTVIFETIGGVYTYWVEAVDTAGNHGPATSTTTVVDEPPDFELKADVTFTAGDYLLNVLERDGDFIGPVNTTATFAEHFTLQGWNTPQDQIAAGYPYYIQPTKDYARWEKVYDLGVTLENVLIHLSFDREEIVTGVTLTYKLAYSTDGVSYTEVSNVYATLAASVRYIRTRMDWGSVP